MNVYQNILSNKQQGKKQFAVLVDPDKLTTTEASSLAVNAQKANVDYIFTGGSLLTNSNFSEIIKALKSSCSIPVVIFPGNVMQVDEQADALLFLSLISGRNADLLIGNHVTAAPFIREKKIETIATGYMLIDSGSVTTALYMSNTWPIPHDKNDIAASTAMAGEMLGLKMIYMDAGSGAKNPISSQMIKSVCDNISLPLIVGGGICTKEKAIENCKAGADLIVMGNSIERNQSLIHSVSEAIHAL